MLIAVFAMISYCLCFIVTSSYLKLNHLLKDFSVKKRISLSAKMISLNSKVILFIAMMIYYFGIRIKSLVFFNLNFKSL